MAFDPLAGNDDSEQEIVEMSGGEGEDAGSTHSSIAELITDTEDEDWDDEIEDTWRR